MEFNFIMEAKTTASKQQTSRAIVPSSVYFSFNTKTKMINFSSEESLKNQYVTLAQSGDQVVMLVRQFMTPETQWKQISDSLKFSSKDFITALEKQFGTSRPNYNKVYMVEMPSVNGMRVFNLVTKETTTTSEVPSMETDSNDNVDTTEETTNNTSETTTTQQTYSII
jgi:hypothetical protein